MEGDGALLEVRSSQSAAYWSRHAGRPELRPEKGREGEREGGGFGAGLRARVLVIPEHA